MINQRGTILARVPVRGLAWAQRTHLTMLGRVWIGLIAFFAFLSISVDPLALLAFGIVREVGTGCVANTHSLLVVFGTDCSGLHADLRAARNLAFDERLGTNR